MKLAHMLNCICPVQKSDLLLINVFSVVDLLKNVLRLSQIILLVLYFVLHRSKILFVLTTKVSHLRNMLFTDSKMELIV